MDEHSSQHGSGNENHFGDMFRFTKNGRPQSTTVLMTFSYSLLFLAIYMLSFFLLVPPVHRLFSPGPEWLSALMESLLPSIAGAVVCSLPLLFVREKQYVPMSYAWLLGYMVLLLIAMLVSLRQEKEALFLFLRLFVMMVPCPLLFGWGLAVFLYRKLRNKPFPPG
jgi:hypothetical protein